MVRPVALARQLVDVVVGNPPWLNYRNTINTMRDVLEKQSRGLYGIWTGGIYATHQDVAGLFFSRAAHLYLRDGGTIGMVLPHSALRAGQYSKWRTGNWKAAGGLRTLGVDFTFKKAWDLEQLKPNSFLPIPASVVFARRLDAATVAKPLPAEFLRWEGKAGEDNVRRVPTSVKDVSARGLSPYGARSRNGATIYPRVFFFVNEVENPTIVPAGQTVTVAPRLGRYDKKPWSKLDLSAITNQTIEEAHLLDVHLGETVVPYATLEPLKALLPLKQSETMLRIKIGEVGGIDPKGLGPRMRERWRTVNALWEVNKAAASKLDILGQLDYMRKLSAQLEWQRSKEGARVRVVYSASGIPTASLVLADDVLVDYTLFWITCRDEMEAHYLLAIINSDTLYQAVMPFMPKGQFGPRHLQKHLWKLPIPGFNRSDSLQREISEAGAAAGEGAAKVLDSLRIGSKGVTVKKARTEIREWLSCSDEGKEVEELVGRLLG